MSTSLPPLAERRPHPLPAPAPGRVDDYYWLRDRDDPAVRAYLEAENAYTAAQLASTAGLQEALYQEMRGRLPEDDASAPERRGAYLYYQRLEAGRQYPVYCRRPLTPADAPEQVVLDVNALAAGHAYCRLGVYEVSPDGRWLAYSVDTAGSEVYTLRVRDLAAGQDLPEQIPNTYYSVKWANDSRHLFYNTLDAARRPDKVWRHVRGAEAAQDALVYHEPEEAFFVWIRKTRSQAYLLIQLHSNTTDEVRYAPADDPLAPFQLFAPRRPGVEYRLFHQAERWLILTNAEAQNFRLLAAPLAAPTQWTEIIGHRPDTQLEQVEVFQEHLVLLERQAGQRRLRLSAPDALTNVRYVPAPEPAYNVTLADYQEFAGQTLRFTYTSLLTPNTVVDYGLTTGAWEVKKQDRIPSGYDPTQYLTERLEAPAADGARVPVLLVYRRDLARDGSAPLLLYGYGAYGANMDPWFDFKRLSLLERGVIFAVAQVRGGGELGRGWYEAGKLLNKRNTFTDFIAAAEHLIAQGYTRPERLAAMGTSAGGLLMGAVLTMRPDLFRCVVARVPFVDVVSSMSDASIPLTVIEWEEWGNPLRPPFGEYMRSYSPYDNIQARAYPAVLVTAGFNDPRVPYWEPAKFVAKLRARKTDANRLLLKTNLGAGHGGASGRYDFLRETALEYAFLLDALGAA